MTVLCWLLSPTPLLAQYGFAIPTELSAGLGAVIDLTPSESTAGANLGFAWVYVRDQWIEPAIEIGLGGTSDEAVCQDEGPLARPETCNDGYVIAGLRFRPLEESDRRLRPFFHLLAGGYWVGTGLKDPEFLPSVFALQPGGGFDIRSPDSIHGLRLVGDYRHVFADPGGRNQLQFVVSYFVGWRGAERTTPPQPAGGRASWVE